MVNQYFLYQFFYLFFFFILLDENEFAPPLEKFRKGYLWVSHLTSQYWCEQQMEYSFTRPEEAVEEPQHVSRGSELHLGMVS